MTLSEMNFPKLRNYVTIVYVCAHRRKSGWLTNKGKAP